MDFWKEVVSEAFDDAGIKASDDQIGTVASWVESAHDNYGTYTGSEFIPNPLEAEIKKIEAAHKREIAEIENEVEVYRNSVSRRRNIPSNQIYIEDGKVLYDL